MKSYLSLSWKELKGQKFMSVLILLAVILSSIMTTAIGQSLGILQTMRLEQASRLNGDRYATFHQITEKQKEQLEEDTRLYDVGSLINVGSIKLENTSLTLYLREFLGNSLNAYPTTGKIKKGRLPQHPLELALPENALQFWNQEIEIGDTLTLSPKASLMDGSLPEYAYQADFTVCGILESNYMGYSTGTLTAVTGEGTASQLLPDDYLLYSTDFKTKDTRSFQSLLDELAEDVGVEEAKIQYNWILLDALGIAYRESGSSDTDTGFSFMTAACVMVGSLVLLAAGLVIYNILKISVTKKIKEYGVLRAMGGERRQIYCLVSLQLLILCGIGIPIGLLVGRFSAKGILMAAMGVLNPDLFMAETVGEMNQNIRAADGNHFLLYLMSIGVTLLFAMLAAFPAARYAASVSPTVAMSGENKKVRRNSRREKRIHNFEAYYARLNLKRGRSRTVITILSLVMSITVFVALQSFTSLLDTSKRVQDMNPGDYAVTSEKVGMSPREIEKLRENAWVEQLAATKLSIYSQDKNGRVPIELNFTLKPSETFQVAGIDEIRLADHAKGLSQQDQRDLQSGKACFVKNPIPIVYGEQTFEASNFKLNDIMEVNGHPLRVVGIVNGAVTANNSGFMNGVQIIVNEETYDQLTGNTLYTEVYPTLRKNADRKAFENWLEHWCKENAGSHWLSYQQTDAQLKESFKEIQMLCWGLILFIALIGILNIMNTVYSNIHTRITEIGIQRAIGMSKRSLYQTFLWEGAYYGMIAAVLGGILGWICTMVIQAAVSGSMQWTAIPWLSILEAAAVSVLVCLTATAIPLGSIAKRNIIESMEAI